MKDKIKSIYKSYEDFIHGATPYLLRVPVGLFAFFVTSGLIYILLQIIIGTYEEKPIGILIFGFFILILVWIFFKSINLIFGKKGTGGFSNRTLKIYYSLLFIATLTNVIIFFIEYFGQ